MWARRRGNVGEHLPRVNTPTTTNGTPGESGARLQDGVEGSFDLTDITAEPARSGMRSKAYEDEAGGIYWSGSSDAVGQNISVGIIIPTSTLSKRRPCRPARSGNWTMIEGDRRAQRVPRQTAQGPVGYIRRAWVRVYESAKMIQGHRAGDARRCGK